MANNPNVRANLRPPWVKGQSGNPSGVPKALLTKTAVELVFQSLTKRTPEELEIIKANPATPALEVMIASIILRAIKDGDPMRLQFLLDRAVGRIPPPVLPDERAIVREEIQSLSDQELLKIVKEKIPEFEAEKPEDG